MEGVLEVTVGQRSRPEAAGQAFGERPANPLDALLSRFAKSVRARVQQHDLRRYGIDEDDVEQDVRIRLWTALQRDPGSELSGAYVQKVVLSAIIDAVRRERTHRVELAHDLQAVEATHPDQGRPPDLMLAHRQSMERVLACIARLPRRRQAPVRLFLLGYTVQELSDATGVSLDAGSKLVRRGLAELRALMAQGNEPG